MQLNQTKPNQSALRIIILTVDNRFKCKNKIYVLAGLRLITHDKIFNEKILKGENNNFFSNSCLLST